MYTLRRWWDRHALQVVLVFIALGTAWSLRRTQGTPLVEIYQWLNRPFQSGPTQAERLSDAQMKELQARAVELESQNKQLKDLLGYAAEQKSGNNGSLLHPIAAPIIGRSADNWWQQVTLGRGSNAGIEVGSSVTAPGGLIGRIISVTPNTSRVLLITDPTSQVGVTVSRSRHMGFLRGYSASQAVMQFFDKVPDVRPGDVISTSPYSQLFPSGIPVGRVESMNLNKSPAPEAIVELSAPIRYLEWVVVYPKSNSH